MFELTPVPASSSNFVQSFNKQHIRSDSPSYDFLEGTGLILLHTKYTSPCSEPGKWLTSYEFVGDNTVLVDAVALSFLGSFKRRSPP